jgi:hypothetical protein
MVVGKHRHMIGVEIEILRAGVTPVMEPTKINLMQSERLELSKKLDGSAKHFTYAGLQESDRIANREEWEEDVK